MDRRFEMKLSRVLDIESSNLSPDSENKIKNFLLDKIDGKIGWIQDEAGLWHVTIVEDASKPE